MPQTWRWFGPAGRVSIGDIMEADVEGVVPALHHVPAGSVWTAEAISKRQARIATMTDGTPSGLQLAA